jgi:hypothetical protein
MNRIGSYSPSGRGAERLFFDATYWVRKAQLTRNKAASENDPKLRERLYRVAFEYQQIADRARQAV